MLGAAKEPQHHRTGRSHQDQRVSPLRAKSQGNHLRHLDVPASHSRRIHRLPAVDDRHVLLQALPLGQSGMGSPQGAGTGGGSGVGATVSVCVLEGCFEFGDEAIVPHASGEDVGLCLVILVLHYITRFRLCSGKYTGVTIHTLDGLTCVGLILPT